MSRNMQVTNSTGWFDWLLEPLKECIGMNRRRNEEDQIELTGRQRFPSFHGGNMGLPNPSNHCFINSLLQCLLVLRAFKSLLKKASKNNFQANQLYSLLNAIKRRDFGRNERKIQLNKLKDDLLSSMGEATEGIPILKIEGGDSRTLFLALCVSFTGENPIKEDPVFSCFCIGDLVKKVTCPRCHKSREFIENPLMLDVQEDLYNLGQQNENFLQSESEWRRCKFCQEKTLHAKKITLTAFPEILALRIVEFSEEESNKEACKTKISLKFQDKGKEDVNSGKIERNEVEYEFVSGVYNTRRGSDGFHSVAYVRKDNGFLRYSDEMVDDVREDQINRYPKLLFYQKKEKKVREFEENPPRPIYDL